MKEHENILRIIDLIGKEINKINNGGEIDWNFFTKAIFFIRNYADKFHHAKEEKILFKEFNKAEGLHCNPTDQMLYEHDLGRGFVKDMELGVREKDKEKVIGGADGYCQLLRDHISKEDNILYPMAESEMNKESQKIVDSESEKVEKENKKVEKECLMILKKLKGGKF